MRSSTSPAHAPTAPKLTKAIERVEGGHTDGIAVAKLDRFGRTLVDGVQQIDRIHKAGGTFASVADGFDISTDTGRLVLRIMLSLAEFELDRVRSNWEDARARARGVSTPAPHRHSATGAPATAGSSPTPTPRPS
ncbi:MAG: recombinase family protein [Solirubrobacteraceae bacterium]|jgi:DNA invertase Pin-like site-specific DNA recombinase